MKNIFLSLLLGLGSWVITSCSSDLSEGGIGGSIAGSVSDATTGEPVATVNVTLSPGGQSTVTGTDGSFSFQYLEEGEYTLQISKEGYKSNSSIVTVRHGEPTPAHLLIERIPSIVTADREVLDFGDNQSLNTLSFNIVNSSYEDLSWEIEHRCDWITEIKPDKGVLPYGKTEGIVVVIDRGKLKIGENKAVIVIRASKGSSQLIIKAIGARISLPILNILAPTEITPTSATFNGEITSPGEPEYSECGFVYSNSPKPTFENTLAKISCSKPSSSKYTYNVTGLTCNTTYFVRAYAKNENGISYSSNEAEFSTTVVFPEVITLDVNSADIDNGTATFRGEVITAGIPLYTERGFAYATFPDPTIMDNKIIANGTGEVGTFSKYVTGLPKTTYYVRSYVISVSGVIYGNQKIVSSEWIELPSAGIAVQRTDIGKGEYSSINTACSNSRLGGFDDWRIPSESELMILYNNREKIGGFKREKYWAKYPGLDFLYYYLDFSNGTPGSEDWRDEKNLYWGRAVRTIKK